MKSQDLVRHLNDTYGIAKEWPKKIEVDADTYANCCNAVFSWSSKYNYLSEPTLVEIILGPNNGIMFKNVELILK